MNSIQKPLAFYRLHSNNYSKRNLKEYNFEINNWIQKNKKKLKKLGFSLIKFQLFTLKYKIKQFLIN